MDISGMYTNVSLEQGLAAFKVALDQRADKTVPTDFLLEVVELVVTTNYFRFDGELFLQLYGVQG